MTPAVLPFDLTWRSSHIEGNALPVNPWWKGQINPGTAPVNQNWRLPNTPVTVALQPDFKSICGGAFSWNYATIGLDFRSDVLFDTCTKQWPTLDIDKSIFVSPVGYCSPDPISGHLEWGFATYTGLLRWQEWDNPSNFADDDANFQLLVPSGAGLTDLNGSTIGLEFRGGESLNNFQSAFWKTVASRVGNSDPMPLSAVSGDRYNQELHATFDNNFAVVTGLVGIDGVHGGQTESHPVTSLAVCTAGCQTDEDTDGVPIIEGADQTWAFFIQNFGAGGGCSELEHTWAGLDDPNDPTSFWYFLSLPTPRGAKGAPQMSSPDIHGADMQPAAGPISWHGWTLSGFRLPDPTSGRGGSVDGEFQLHYQTAAPPPKKQAAPLKAALGPRTEDPELGNIVERVRDPAVARQLRDYLTAHPLSTRPTAPHAFVLQVQARNASAEAALARVDKGEMGARRLDHPRVDAQRLRARLQLLADVQKIVGPAKTALLPPRSAVETPRP